MTNEANPVDPSHNDLPQTHWQILGELQLPIGSHPDGTINQWLQTILSPFNLPDDLVVRILKSMEEAAARILASSSAKGDFEYLALVILAPAGLNSRAKTWGFFRVERTAANRHCIEYYIYWDTNSVEHRLPT